MHHELDRGLTTEPVVKDFLTPAAEAEREIDCLRTRLAEKEEECQSAWKGFDYMRSQNAKLRAACQAVASRLTHVESPAWHLKYKDVVEQLYAAIEETELQ